MSITKHELALGNDPRGSGIFRPRGPRITPAIRKQVAPMLTSLSKFKSKPRRKPTAKKARPKPQNANQRMFRDIKKSAASANTKALVFQGLEKSVIGADALVIEATYLSAEADLAKKFGHLTAAQAGELAKRSGVRHLYLTHISRRYREKDVVEEARSIFLDSTVARDFDHFQIKRAD